jgi:DNA-binding SARP family transcriptional activator
VWRIRLLGETCLEREDGRLEKLERRGAVLVAYLALEGPTSRAKLAGMLWPDRTDDTARANLRQRLKRLRDAVGAELIVADETLRLRPDLTVDAVQLESLAFTGEYAAVLRFEGELLAGLEMDLAPEFEEWLLLARERLFSLRREALVAEADRLEREGALEGALGHAERLLEVDPVSEEAHRRVMRLRYLRGDRSGAIQTFERCREVLRREFSLEPLPETTNLARLIEQGVTLPGAPQPARVSIPLSVLRPPVLVGRAAPWAALEAAWETGIGVVVRGEPGVGKTRLMLDFAASKGPFEQIEGRPGDEGVPYATFARHLRGLLERRDVDWLEPWANRELARLVPELESKGPPPLQSESEKLRFLEAIATLLEQLHRHGVKSIVLDDLQFMDAASFEAVTYLTARLQGKGLRCVLGHRSGELGSERAASIDRAVSGGSLVVIELRTLEPNDLSALLNSLGLTDTTDLAAALTRYTGGNPLFVLETVKNLIETDQIGRGLPQRMPPPGKVGALIRRRLERLSAPALRLARVAAVTGTDFTLEMCARILDVNVFDLTEPLAELGDAQVMHTERFAHDLILEATLEGVPAPIRTLVHRRTAEHLETVQAEPARIAHHYLGAGEGVRAIPHLRAAAERSQARYRFTEAAVALEQAAALAQAANDRQASFDVLDALAEVMCRFDTGERQARVIERLDALATSDLERARVRLREARRLNEHAGGEDGERAAHEGLEYAERTDDRELQIALLDALAHAMFLQKRPLELLGLLERLRALHALNNDEAALAIMASRIGIALDQLERHREALEHYERAAPILERLDRRMGLVSLLHNQAVCLDALGDGLNAMRVQRRSLDLLRDTEGATNLAVHCWQGLALRALALESYIDAGEALDRTLALVPAEWGISRTFSHHLRAVLLGRLGQPEPGLTVLEDALARATKVGSSRRDRIAFHCVHAELLRQLGRDPSEPLALAESLLEDTDTCRVRARVTLARARASTPNLALTAASALHAEALRLDLPGWQIAAATVAAHALVALERSDSALEFTHAALALLERYVGTDTLRAEVMLTHVRALEALGRDAEASDAASSALAWVLEVADQRVPTEFRDAFLNHPVNAQVLETAHQMGFALP